MIGHCPHCRLGVGQEAAIVSAMRPNFRHLRLISDARKPDTRCELIKVYKRWQVVIRSWQDERKLSSKLVRYRYEPHVIIRVQVHLDQQVRHSPTPPDRRYSNLPRNAASLPFQTEFRIAPAPLGQSYRDWSYRESPSTELLPAGAAGHAVEPRGCATLAGPSRSWI